MATVTVNGRAQASLGSDPWVVYSNTVTATTTTPESNYTDNTATAYIGVVSPMKDVAIVKGASPGSGVAGVLMTWGVSVNMVPMPNVVLTSSDGLWTSNWSGGGPMGDITVTDVLPAGFSVEEVVGVTGGSVTVTGQTVVVNYPSVSSFPTSFAIRSIPSAGLPAGDYTNVVEVSSPNDSNPLNNNATAIYTIVEPEGDLFVEKFVTPEQILVGQDATFTVVVTNDGIIPLEDVIVVDELPAGMQFISAVANAGQVSISGTTVTCDFGDLAPGEMRILTIVMRGLSVGTFTNVVVGSTPTTQPTGNDTASASVFVGTQFGTLRVIKQLNGPAISPVHEILVTGAGFNRTLYYHPTGTQTMLVPPGVYSVTEPNRPYGYVVTGEGNYTVTAGATTTATIVNTVPSNAGGSGPSGPGDPGAPGNAPIYEVLYGTFTLEQQSSERGYAASHSPDSYSEAGAFLWWFSRWGHKPLDASVNRTSNQTVSFKQEWVESTNWDAYAAAVPGASRLPTLTYSFELDGSDTHASSGSRYYNIHQGYEEPSATSSGSTSSEQIYRTKRKGVQTGNNVVQWTQNVIYSYNYSTNLSGSAAQESYSDFDYTDTASSWTSGVPAVGSASAGRPLNVTMLPTIDTAINHIPPKKWTYSNSQTYNWNVLTPLGGIGATHTPGRRTVTFREQGEFSYDLKFLVRGQLYDTRAAAEIAAATSPPGG